MAIEDLTTWTEVDPNSRRTVTSSKVVVYRAQRGDSGGRVYHDVGNGKINEFNISFEYTPKENEMVTGSTSGMFCVCNELADTADFSEDFVLLYHYMYNWKPRLIFSGGTISPSDMTFDTKYYLTLYREKNGTTVYCYVYSDSDRNNLLYTISVAVDSDATYRYLTISNDLNSETNETKYGSYDVENVDIGDLDNVNTIASLMW